MRVHTLTHTHTSIYERQKSRTTCFTIVIVIVRGLLSESPNVNCKNTSHASNCRINRVRGNKDRQWGGEREGEERQEDTSSANSIMSTGLQKTLALMLAWEIGPSDDPSSKRPNWLFPLKCSSWSLSPGEWAQSMYIHTHEPVYLTLCVCVSEWVHKIPIKPVVKTLQNATRHICVRVVHRKHRKAT